MSTQLVASPYGRILRGLIGATALLGLALVLPACGADSASDSAALNSGRINADGTISAEDGPASVEIYSIDGLPDVDGRVMDPNTGTYPMCSKSTDGGPTSCKDEATWKSYGEKFCGAKGQTLHSLTFSGSCGRGHWSQAHYECCPKVTPPPPPPPPPGCGCSHEKAGGACKDRGGWKTDAERACKAKGKILTRIEYNGTCGCDSFSGIEFECCGGAPPPPPPPPPPPMCVYGGEGGTGVCKSEADWKAAGEAFCKSKGLGLKNLSLGAACGAMGYRGYSEAKYECCKTVISPE